MLMALVGSTPPVRDSARGGQLRPGPEIRVSARFRRSSRTGRSGASQTWCASSPHPT